MFAGRRVLGALALGCLVLAAGAAPAPNAADAALAYAQKHASQFGISSADASDVAVSSTVVSRHSGVTHVYLQQRHRGIEVWGAIINVSVAKDGRVLSSGSTFVANIAEAAGEQSVRTSDVEAVEAAADHLNLKIDKSLRVMQRKGGASERATLSDAGIAARPIDLYGDRKSVV